MNKNSNEKSPTRASLRIFLSELIKTDAELNAFCIDHFPGIYKEFSAGMLCTEKYNLLINCASGAKILGCVKEIYPQKCQEYMHLLVFINEAVPKTDGHPIKGPRLYRIAKYAWTFLVMILMGALIFFNSGKVNFFSEKIYSKLGGWMQLGPPVLTIRGSSLRVWRLSMSRNNQKMHRLDIIDPIAGRVITTKSFIDDCSGMSRLMKTEKYVFLVYSCESKATIFSNQDETPVWNEHDFLHSVGGIETEAVNFLYQDEYGDILIYGKNGTPYNYSSAADKVTEKSYGIDLNRTREDKEISFLRFGKENEDHRSIYFPNLSDGGLFHLYEITARLDPRWIVSEEINPLIFKNEWQPRVFHQVSRISDQSHFSPKILYQDGYLSLIAYRTNAANNAPTLLKLLKGRSELLTISGETCEQYKEILHSHPKTVMFENRILILGQSATMIDLLALDPSVGRLSMIYHM